VRTRAATFVCKGCGQVITRAPSPANDRRKDYCKLACKLRVWWRTHEHTRKQRFCACGNQLPKSKKRYCSTKCRVEAKLTESPTRDCVECGTSFVSRRISKKTCSPACRYARLRKLLQGKKYKPSPSYQRICTRCSKAFTTHRDTITMCRFCVRAIDPNRDHGKHEKRAKRAGVPYVYGIKPEKVFARDGWRCHICGCRTPKRLRGKNLPTSPELDHIVPITVPGSPGHVWDNVACACRSCNIRKGHRILGQLRLAV
jgi:hypothetical protein